MCRRSVAIACCRAMKSDLFGARATARERLTAIVRTLLLTGQRRDEVSGLTWSELDPGLTV